MALSLNDLENMESFELNLKLDKCSWKNSYPIKVTYAGRPVEWRFNPNHIFANETIQFDLLLHEDLAFTSEKPLKVKKFHISWKNKDPQKKPISEKHTEIEYTYSDGVFRFDPLRCASADDVNDIGDVHFSFLLDKSGFVSTRNVTIFPDYTYIIKWNLNEASLRQKFIILDSQYIQFTYRMKPILWQLKLCSYWMCDQQMFRLTLQTPDKISFNRDDPILKSNVQFFRGNQCLIITTNDSYSWDGNMCSFVTPYEMSKLLTTDSGKLKVQFEFTVVNSDPENIELPSRSTELASCSTIAEIPNKMGASYTNIAEINKKKMDTELADMRKKSTLFSEYNYVLKWDSLALPKESSPVQVTYRQSHITWNMKLTSCTKIDKNFVKFTLHTANKIRFHRNESILYSSLIIMRDGFLLVSKSNDLYTLNDGTFEFQTTYDTSDWRKSGDYKIRFEFTLENRKQQYIESICSSIPASSNSSDSFEIITREQCSDDGSISTIEAIPTEAEAAPTASITTELPPISSSCTSLDDLLSLPNDDIDIVVSDETHDVKSSDQCSDDDSTSSIEDISDDIVAGQITTTSEALALPETKDDCLSVANDEKPAAVSVHKDTTLVEDFQRLFDTSSNYDTVINLVFKVHRSILAIRSPEFDRMIKADQTTNQSGLLKLSITDITYGEMSALLKFIYTGTMSTDQSCRTMIAVAERFGVIGLRVLCEDILCNDICATNFLDNIHLINECKSEKVHECLLTFMQKNISSLVNCIKFRQFMTRNPEIMFKLLSRVAKPNLQV